MTSARAHMVETQIAARGVTDPRVLEALRQVPRHRFVPPGALDQAHADHPLPIGAGQTISQPYIVAYMAEALALRGHERVLEVGSGSGYMAAVLSRLAKDVCAVELEAALTERAQLVLTDLGYKNVHLRTGDGTRGWPEQAPFDAILLSCAASSVPEPLLGQLSENGILLLPLGPPLGFQVLVKFQKTPQGLRRQDLLAVSFVPLR